MRLLVGCPVRDRNWILQSWFDHVLVAGDLAGVDLEFVFVVAEDDLDSREFLSAWSDEFGLPVDVTVLSEPAFDGRRDWNVDRLEHMVSLRNVMLRRVRKFAPEVFLSLDSDVLLAPESIGKALKIMADESPVVLGQKAYLSEFSTRYPNMGLWANSNHTKFYREDCDYLKTVDIVMAVKFMSPDAYNVDYRYHFLGEDLGWSSAISKIYGRRLLWDGSTVNKHVMHPDLLGLVDSRVGW